jgi:hypothetical protein
MGPGAVNENTPVDALLASQEVREWGVLACAFIVGVATIKAGFPDLVLLAPLAWSLR